MSIQLCITVYKTIEPVTVICLVLSDREPHSPPPTACRNATATLRLATRDAVSTGPYIPLALLF